MGKFWRVGSQIGAGLCASDSGLSLQSVNLSLSGGWGVRYCAEPGESFCRIVFFARPNVAGDAVAVLRFYFPWAMESDWLQ